MHITYHRLPSSSPESNVNCASVLLEKGAISLLPKNRCPQTTMVQLSATQPESIAPTTEPTADSKNDSATTSAALKEHANKSSSAVQYPEHVKATILPRTVRCNLACCLDLLTYVVGSARGRGCYPYETSQQGQPRVSALHILPHGRLCMSVPCHVPGLLQ